jgi:hypothetical protein
MVIWRRWRGSSGCEGTEVSGAELGYAQSFQFFVASPDTFLLEVMLA